MFIRGAMILLLVCAGGAYASELDYSYLETDVADQDESVFVVSSSLSQILGFESVAGIDTRSYLSTIGVQATGLISEDFLIKVDIDFTYLGADGLVDIGTTDTNVRNLFVQNDLNDGTLTTGYQTLNWTEMSFLTSLNVLSPNAPVEVSIFAADQGTVGQPIVHWKKYSDARFVEFFVNVEPQVSLTNAEPIIFTEFNRLIESRSGFEVDKPSAFSEYEFGFRGGMQVDTHELSFVYARLHSNDILVVNNDLQSPDILSLRYPEFDYFALSGNQARKSLLFSYEITLSEGHALSYSDNLADIWTLAAGVEYSFGNNVNASLEARHVHFDADFIGLTTESDSVSFVDNVAVSISKSFLAESLIASYLALWDSVSHDWSHTVYSAYRFNDKLSFDFILSKAAETSNEVSILDGVGASLKVSYLF